MKCTLITVSALIATAGALAQPHGHQHQKHHEKRAIVWKTATEVVTETIPITTTVWISADEAAVTSSSAGIPGEFYQTLDAAPDSVQSTTSATPTKSASSTPEPVASSTPAPAVLPAAVQPLTSPTTSAVVVVAPSSTPPQTPTPSTPATASTEAAAAPSDTSDQGSSGYTGVCASGSPCTGDITYYEAGLGACGDVNDGDTQRVVALPHGLMGTQSNGNPFCNMTITIQRGGKTTTAIVVDKCMGCVGNSIDLSNLAFSDLAEFSVGRTTATWWFN